MVTLVNRAKMSTSTTGTGTITLGSAETGYQTFADAGVANGDVVRYVIEDGNDWEIGSGTYTSSGTTLSRTVDESSNAGSAINLSGSAVVFITAAAGDVFQGDLIAENPVSYTAPSATGDDAVAIGDTAIASNANSIAIGRTATASGSNAFALYQGTASGAGALAFRGTASGSSSMALMFGTTASSVYGCAIGQNSGAQGSQAVTGTAAMALGGSYASGVDSFAAAIANNTSSYGATGANSVAIGAFAKATLSDSLAIGDTAAATANWAIAIGRATCSGGSGVSIGDLNNVSGGYGAALGGRQNEVTVSYAVATGYKSLASITGKKAHSSGVFSSTGDAQTGTFVLRSDTTDATPEVLTATNSTASTTNQVILPNNSAYSFSGTIIARESAAAGSDYASWEIKGALLRDANAASTVLGNGIVNKLYATSGASAWAVALSADTTNGGLKVEVTGAAATNIRWVATVNTSEVTYA